MKLALLGGDPQALALAKAAAQGADHQLVWACVPDRARCELTGVSFREDWESLLTGSVADAVIVSPGEPGEDDWRADQLRALVQARIPLLAVHPVHPSLLVYYEIESMRGDPPSVLVPYLPWREHPAVRQLVEQSSAEQAPALGAIEQVIFERFLPTRTADTVARQFAVDVDLAAQFTGDLTQLGAMAPGVTAAQQDPQYANLGVQAFGNSGVMLRWSVGPVDDRPGARITVLGSDGKATITAPDDQPWTLEYKLRDADASPPPKAFPDWNAPQLGLRWLQDAIDGKPTPVDWTAALRAVELAEAIPRSLKRRRTVDVKREDPSEANAFKGNMIAFGCSLMMLMLPLFVFGIFLGNSGYPRLGRWLLYFGFGLLAVFLLVQSLGLFASRDSAEGKPS